MRHKLDAPPDPNAVPVELAVREATDAELPELLSLARQSHRSTRFYFDGGFPHERCDELYARWLERALREPHRTLLVGESGGRVLGYEAVAPPRPDGEWTLDLIAVVEDQRGRGVGAALLRGSVAWASERGATGIVTALQARNVSSLATHERLGFRCARSQAWYHRWFEPLDG
jgi:GNAT superfamily N-acetyltransferase